MRAHCVQCIGQSWGTVDELHQYKIIMHCYCVLCWGRFVWIFTILYLQTAEQLTISHGPLFLWEHTSDLSSGAVVHIVNFAKKIPGFLKLTRDDQITSVRAACLEVMVCVCLIYCFSTCHVCINNYLDDLILTACHLCGCVATPISRTLPRRWWQYSDEQWPGGVTSAAFWWSIR